MARFTRALLEIRTRAPAVAYATCLACGQLAAWAAGPQLSLALATVLALLLAVGERGRIVPHAAMLVGVVSCLPALLVEHPAIYGDDRSALVLVRGGIRRSQPGQVTFEALDLIGGGRALLACRAVELPWRNAARLQEGAIVWIRGRFEPVERQLNPWSWDSWLWRRGTAAQVTVRFVSHPVGYAPPSPLDSARERLKEQVERIAPSRRGAALLLSMALGYRDVLSEPVERAFSRLGLTHLLVVSGYQVSMVFAAVHALMLMAGARSLRGGIVRPIAAAASLAAALMYVLFIGAEMSASRAMIAATCACLEGLTEGGRRFAQRWGVALLVMQLLWPWAILEIGVQLTFAALAGIGIGSVLGFGSVARTVAWVQVSVWLLTSTLIAAWSGAVTVSGLLLNIVAASAWSALNCTVGLAVLGLTLISGPVGVPLLKAVMSANEALASAVMTISDWPASRIELAGPSRAAATVLLAAASALLILRAWSRHKTAMIASLAR